MKWIKIRSVPYGPRGAHCFQCGDYLAPRDDAVEGRLGTYCSEGCCTEYEQHDEGLWPQEADDYE